MAKRIHIVGRKNSGKTTLVVELVSQLTKLGYRVGTIKHTHHHHELDMPGKDSFRHRQAGAAVVGILAPQMTAIFRPVGEFDSKADRYAVLMTTFEQCDLVVVEGDSQTDAPKIEVWRAATQSQPLSATDDSILAVVTNDPFEFSVPVLSRSNISGLASWIMDIAYTPNLRAGHHPEVGDSGIEHLDDNDGHVIGLRALAGKHP